MKTKKLRITKNKVYVFEMIQTTDGFGNTYKAFKNGYTIFKGKRTFFSDMQITGWETLKSFYSYNDPYRDVKEWINENTNKTFRYMSDAQNVIVCCESLDNKTFERITKA